MEYWFTAAIFLLVFCVMGVFVLTAFQSSLVQPIYDSVNFNNPLMVMIVLLVVIVVAFGWMAHKTEQNESRNLLAALRHR